MIGPETSHAIGGTFARTQPLRHVALPGIAKSARTSSGYQAAVWAIGGLVACGILATDSVPPLRAVVLMAAMLTALTLITISTTGFSILPRLAVFLYALPFSATLGYLFDQDFVWWETPLAVPLCLDPVLNARMVWIGICGLAGLAFGIQLRTAIGVNPPREASQSHARVLSAIPFFILLVSAVLLSQLSAPTKTIWEASYASEAAESAGANLNFNASFLVSYLILILLYIDSENEPSGSRRRREKRIWLAAASLYIVVALQLMRGDRECAGLLAGIIALYLTSGHQSGDWLLRHRERLRRAAYVTIPSLAIICLLISLGFLRSTLSTGESTMGVLSTIPKRALTLNTWTGVLLTNLGMVAEEAGSSIELKHGSTYVDYLFSLPPGIITQAVGYKRPMDGTNSPNWWYSPLTGGGVHPCVVPYNNFGIVGVFAIMALIGAFVTRCELLAQGHGLGNRVLYGCVVTVSMLWLWYGDMNLIRALMGCGILIVVHRLGSVSHFHQGGTRRGQQTA